MNKYSMTKQTMEYEGRTLTRIVANRDFGRVREGTYGGFIQDTRNLSFRGNSWVAAQAMAFDEARISENGVLGDCAIARGKSLIAGDAFVGDYALIDQSVYVGGHAVVRKQSYLSGSCSVFGFAKIYCSRLYSNSGLTLMPNVGGLARIGEDACLSGRVTIKDNALVFGEVQEQARIIENGYVGSGATVRGRALISGKGSVVQWAVVGDRSVITGDSIVGAHAIVIGKSLITGRACIVGHALIKDSVYSGDNFVTTVKGWLEIHPVCPSRPTSGRREHAGATPVSAICH